MRGGTRGEKGRSLLVKRILERWNCLLGNEGGLCSEKFPFPSLGSLLPVSEVWGGLGDGTSASKLRSFKSRGAHLVQIKGSVMSDFTTLHPSYK